MWAYEPNFTPQRRKTLVTHVSWLVAVFVCAVLVAASSPAALSQAAQESVEMSGRSDLTLSLQGDC